MMETPNDVDPKTFCTTKCDQYPTCYLACIKGKLDFVFAFI